MSGFDKSQLDLTIAEITELGTNKSARLIEAKILLPDGELIIPSDIKRLNKVLDYDNNHSETITVDLNIGLADYLYKVYPNRDNLEISITETIYDEKNNIEIIDDIVEVTYKAILVESGDKVLELAGNTGNKSEANKTPLIPFQLIDKAMLFSRTEMVQGVVSADTPLVDLITYYMSRPNRVKGVNLYPPDNEANINNLLIPHGTRISDIPRFLQEMVGIYNSGIGWFLKDSYWFVFPKYKLNPEVTRFELNIIHVPEERITGLEVTYYMDVALKTLSVITYGKTVSSDQTEKKKLSNGNGVLYRENNLLDENFKTTDNDNVILEGMINTRKLTSGTIDDGDVVAYYNNEWATTNSFREVSRLAKDRGLIVVVTWNKGDENLLYPGMKVTLSYIQDGEVMINSGILLKATADNIKAGKGEKSIFNKIVRITLFLERNLENIATE